MSTGHDERMRRWRLALGAADSGASGVGTGVSLTGDDARIDAALGALYDSGSDAGSGPEPPGKRQAGLGASAPQVARWLGDIRTFFPVSVVQVMQKDAIERLGLTRLLLEPEMLDAVQPDVHLVGTLLSLSQALPEQARESARAVVRTVTSDLERRLAQRARSAVTGALNRASRTSRPRRPADIDWDRTIRANLRNYLPQHRTIVPDRLVGYARKQQAVARDVIVCLDQSGSMASSVVYGGVFGAVLASIRSLRTSVVAFGTSVVDLTEQLSDPVDVLFGIQLGGGTDINRALAYCQRLITRPASTILILVSDLFEGGNRSEMLRRVADMTAAGTRVIALLALSDDGAPSYDHELAAALAELGVPAFACTPDSFGDLMAAAIERRDIAEWAHRQQAPALRRAQSFDDLGGRILGRRSVTLTGPQRHPLGVALAGGRRAQRTCRVVDLRVGRGRVLVIADELVDQPAGQPSAEGPGQHGRGVTLVGQRGLVPRMGAALRAPQERRAALRGYRSGRDHGLDLTRAHDSSRGDLRKAGDRGHLADQRQQAVVSAGRVVVRERPPVGASLMTLDAQYVGACRGRDRRLIGTGHRDRDQAARILQGADHLGGRTAEGEAGDRGRIRQQRRDLAVEAVVVPGPAAQRPGGAQGAEITI
jgi:Mg-chelatase subunit ChlD